MNLIKEEREAAKKYYIETEQIDFNNKSETIVKLTRKNVALIEAMITTDSNYRKSIDDTRGPKNKYRGSSSYWLKNLKQIIDNNKKKSDDGYTYEDIIDNLINSIDVENSTHLNSDGLGRKNVKERIIKLGKDKLIDYLKEPKDEYKLINLIQTPEGNEKRHFSFATKFCHYACLYLFKNTEYEDNYSIYDNVISSVLPKYIKKYLDEDVNKKDYEYDYKKYINYIDRIRSKVEENNIKISRNGFDHLLWYYHKG